MVSSCARPRVGKEQMLDSRAQLQKQMASLEDAKDGVDVQHLV